MDQAERAAVFAALHSEKAPLVLYNVWDAGSARAVAEAGAAAIATGSWSVAAAQGYEDGERIPLALVETLVRRIAASVALPVSVDLEGGYGAEPAAVAGTAQRILAAGAVGINLEDQVVGGTGLHPLSAQAERIAAIRAVAGQAGIPLFVNARSDLFLKERDTARHPALLEEALRRGAAYAEAGASGIFVPGLADEPTIRALCAALPLPVNVMMRQGVPPVARLAELGVRRVSFGPAPYLAAMAWLRAQAAEQLGSAAHG